MNSKALMSCLLGVIVLHGCATHTDVRESGPVPMPVRVAASAEPLSVPPDSKPGKEPALEEYKELPGDHGHRDRVEELISECKAGRVASVLQLGSADIDKAELIERLKHESPNFPYDVQKNTTYALARLGDLDSRSRIENTLMRGHYPEQDEAVEALEYCNDPWSAAVLMKGLSIAGSSRKQFSSSEELIGAGEITAPAIRYVCASALLRRFPGSHIQEDPERMTDVDVEGVVRWVENQNQTKKVSP